MQNNREQIDDFLQSKLQDVQFDLNEKHWADAERRLDEEDKKKRPFWFLFLAVVLLVGAGLTALTQKGEWNKKATVQASQPSSNHTKNATPNTSMAANQIAYTTEQKSTSQNKDQSENTSMIDKQINRTENKNTEHQRSNNKSTSKTAFTQKVKASSQNTMPANEKAFAENNMSKKVEKPVNSTINTSIETTKSFSNKEKTAVNTSTTKAASVEKNTSTRNAIKTESEINQTTSTEITESSTTTTAIAKNSAVSNVKSNDATDGMVMLGNSRVYKTPEDYQRLNPRYVASLQNYTYTETTIPLNKSISDSIRQEVENLENASQNKKRDRDPKIFEQGPSTFFLLFGGAGAKGYKGNLNKNPDWGFSPSLGIGYEATFSDRMSMYLSVYMSYINNLNIKETGAKVTYSFDKDSTLLSVTRKNLLQLHVPIQLSYKLLPRLSMKGGIGFNLGLNTISMYEDVKNSTSENRFGYTDGLRFLDINANFGYDYAVTKRLTMGIFYQQGFLDMTKNDYFNNKHRDINARGGVILRYKFKK